MKSTELRNLIREEIRKALKEVEAALYTDWEEHVNPDYIVVRLKDGRKLQISKSHIAGGTKVYQAILQAFADERTDITNKIVGAMSAMMGGTLKKESALQEGYGSVKPIKTFKVTALAKIFKSLGFPVKKVETYNNINAGPTLSIEFVNTLKDENEFIDAYQIGRAHV